MMPLAFSSAPFQAIKPIRVLTSSENTSSSGWPSSKSDGGGPPHRRSISVAEGIDATTPAGKLQMHILAAIAEFERARIAERVTAGLARARAQGQRLGRRPHRINDDDLERVGSLSTRKAAAALGVPASVLHRARLARTPKSATA